MIPSLPGMHGPVHGPWIPVLYQKSSNLKIFQISSRRINLSFPSSSHLTLPRDIDFFETEWRHGDVIWWQWNIGDTLSLGDDFLFVGKFDHRCFLSKLISISNSRLLSWWHHIWWQNQKLVTNFYSRVLTDLNWNLSNTSPQAFENSSLLCDTSVTFAKYVTSDDIWWHPMTSDTLVTLSQTVTSLFPLIW